ncbi:hypothetical protein M9Y10_019047 [Tritrichomonas musculus]|uniref:Histone acetyltransferase n=1 Tax=Tritrichomonas musculus TaxID=1915356 RepID=A0ABR2HJE6_9EUKA
MYEDNQEFKAGSNIVAFCNELEKNLAAQIVVLDDSQENAYVHFLHQDKRLDRWMPIHSLQHYDEKEFQKQQPHNDERVKTRFERRLEDDYSETEDEQLTPDIQQFELIHKEVTKIRYIEEITIGNYQIRTWYFSPYPRPFHFMKHLFICEFCFKYFSTKENLEKHLLETNEKHPPGREIYRKDGISIFELQGKHQKLTCQCLCLLAKLFLDHKTLFYDVEGFNFYVLCECDEQGAHVAAYFSRELSKDVDNILACIVAFPPYQKKGYGRLLISLGYEIAKRQRRSGGPERPLSDLGKVAFSSYWRDTIVELLKIHGKEIMSIEDIEKITSIQQSDVIDTLKRIQCVTKVKGEYELSINKDALSKAISELSKGKVRRKIDPMKLIWFPEEEDI